MQKEVLAVLQKAFTLKFNAPNDSGWRDERVMQTRVTFDVSDDSRTTILTIQSNLPITMPEYIEHFESFLRDIRVVYADEIEKRKRMFESGKVVPFLKE
jgi:hypothetical protein